MTNSRLNIVFIGCVSFSELMLDTLSSISEINICGIVTRSSSAFNSDFVDLGTHNCAAQSSVFYYEKSKDELFFQWLKNIAPDYIFCFGWSTLLPQRILDIPKYGVVGYHPSLLPKSWSSSYYLGSCLRLNSNRLYLLLWIMRLTLVQSYLNQSRISLTDNAISLFENLCISCIPVERTMSPAYTKTHKAKPQDPRLATSWRKRTYEDGKID